MNEKKITLWIRTDQPEAQLKLVTNETVFKEVTWLAHRELSDSLLLKIKALLDSANIGLQDLKSVCVFQGPGSFTGLRIGITVANTLAYSLGVPAVAVNETAWNSSEVTIPQESGPYVSPHYGSEANITAPRK